MPSIEPPRISAERPRLKSTLPRSLLLVALVATVFAVVLVGCSSEEEPTSVPTATQVPPDTPTPAPTPTSDPGTAPATERPASNGEVTKDEVLATAFDQWGSTCLNEAYPANAPQLDDVDESDFSGELDGVRFAIIKEGDGASPALDWEVDVQYTGWLEDGCVFDSSYTRSEPSVFPVGAVIPGWQSSLTEMKVGERRRVVIPPDLAYGPTGSPPVIPANATLTFDIILVSAVNSNAALAEATQAADELLARATVEAAEFDADAAGFEPIDVDYVTDVQGFLAELPKGEVTCMTAYAGGEDAIVELFTSGFRPALSIVEKFDECLSDATTRNVAAGRIRVLGSDLSDETMSCIEGELKNPTLKPLFGIFDAAQVSEEWITAHFCLTTEERVTFEEALYANQPGREPIGSGKTFIDVQECMVGELGAAKYFEPVSQPDTGDRVAMDKFFSNFTAFMLADIRCRQGDAGYPLADGTLLSEDAAVCISDSLGEVRFGEVLLDRVWVPTVEEHTEAAAAYNDCGVTTDFLELPASVDSLQGSDLTCVLGELENHENARQTSLRAYAEIGARGEIKTGDLVAFMFATQTCGIELPGVPDGGEISDEVAMCITGKIDRALLPEGRSAVIPAFGEALADSADCFADQ